VVNTGIATIAFVVGAVVSLSTSWLLVSKIERIGRSLNASEAILGLLAALAADTPEISSALSALIQQRQAVATGVVIGSNVFNLAALLGLGAVIAGRILLHRRVVLFAGAVAVWIALVCLLTVAGVVSPIVGLLLVVAVFVPYVLLAGFEGIRLPRFQGNRFARWLTNAVVEEELELSEAIHPPPARSGDVVLFLVALAVVVTASITMERAATTLGVRYGVPEIVVGAVVLAAVTSLPNAVAAVYLARRGRATATLSEALNSNAINVLIGLLLPASILGLGAVSIHSTFIACWYLGLTVVILVLAYAHRGIRRPIGILILVAYGAFVATLVTTASRSTADVALLVAPPFVVVVVAAFLLWIRPR
jgi:cation:H+ antiporter